MGTAPAKRTTVGMVRWVKSQGKKTGEEKDKKGEQVTVLYTGGSDEAGWLYGETAHDSAQRGWCPSMVCASLLEMRDWVIRECEREYAALKEWLQASEDCHVELKISL